MRKVRQQKKQRMMTMELAQVAPWAETHMQVKGREEHSQLAVEVASHVQRAVDHRHLRLAPDLGHLRDHLALAFGPL